MTNNNPTTRPAIIVTADMVDALEADFRAQIEQSHIDAAIARKSDQLSSALGLDAAAAWSTRRFR